MSNTIENVVNQDEHDSFTLGLDWLIPKNSQRKPVLIEFNLSQDTKKGTYSSIRHFLINSMDKAHQHQVFGKFMPAHTSDKNEFKDFVKRHDQVVYKSRIGSMGEGVSVLVEPDHWEYDLIEEFVLPCSQNTSGKRYPFVIREYVEVYIDGRNLHWERDEIFRKQSRVSVEEAKNPNDAFKLNTMSGIAMNVKTTKHEDMIIEQITPLFFDELVKVGQSVSWNPTRYYSDALVGLYQGYQGSIFLSSSYPKLKKLLLDQSINPVLFPFEGELSRVFEAAKLGMDFVFLTGQHSVSHTDSPRVCYGIRRENSLFEHCYRRGQSLTSPFESFPEMKNVAILGEFTPEEFAEKIKHNYRENRRKI